MLALIIALLLGMPTCASEDSTDCVWIASEQGNGAGASFVDIDGTAYYFGGAR
jgi:hypothetical protein